ncbi:MAG: DNA-binding protein WhiA [Clostridiales bacterium]|nr:DNA-binding protein WhiA [Clostridiales bacterium]
MNARPRSVQLRLAQLAGLTLSCGSIRLGSSTAILCQSESEQVAAYIHGLAPRDLPLERAMLQKQKAHRRVPLYLVSFSGEGVPPLLERMGVMQSGAEGILLHAGMPKSALSGAETKRAFLRGCFLGGGYCSDPKRGYRMELVVRDDRLARDLAALLTSFSLTPERAERSGRQVIYVQDAENVTGFLALLGASVGAMALMDVQAEKDMRNYVNRANNCEMANLGKQVDASLQQQAAIRTVLEKVPSGKLPPTLREAAELRLNYPDATLAELAARAGIAKSGMYHRLARLLKLAGEL